MPHPFQRRETRRRIARKVLIGYEGKTELYYLEAIQSEHRLPAIQFVKADGHDPLSVVSAVMRALDEQSMERGGWRKGDTAWAVFDGDEHIENSEANWKAALRLAEQKGIELAITNPCFELWYLLHFQDQFARLSRNQAQASLKRRLPNYEKTRTLYPDPLRDLTDTAIERAKALEARAVDNRLPPHQNPCAGAYKLVELLLSLAR